MIRVFRRAAGVGVLVCVAGVAGAAGPEVRPGAVVRWPGGGIESCSMAGKVWAPVECACWYPVDLLTPAGTLELGRSRGGLVETTSVVVGSYPYPVQELRVEPGTVELAPEDLERAEREAERVAALWELDTPRRFTLPLAPPLDPMPEPRSFGSRRVFNGHPRSPHTGADLPAPRGTPVHAAAAGVVALAEEHFFSGGSVFVDHGDGLVTMVFHLDRIDVERGQEVERGQVLGTVGATGRATGPHLHLGVRWHGARVDPSVLLATDGAVVVDGE